MSDYEEDGNVSFRPAWERLADESDPAWAAFQMYHSPVLMAMLPWSTMLTGAKM